MANYYNLDLSAIEADIKQYLKDNSSYLEDYNYEGSATSALVKLLAYVTRYQLYYLNAVTKELFLSSAELSNSVYRLANMLNYLPKRNVAPYCTVSLSNTINSTLSVNFGDTFTVDDIVLTYMDNSINIAPLTSSTITLYEGILVTNNYLSDGTSFQTYELADRETVANNEGFLTVSVTPKDSSTVSDYSNVNLSNPVAGEKYYYIDYLDTMNIKFDNGTMFEKPNVEDTITISYLKTNGNTYDGSILAGTTLTNNSNPSLTAYTMTALLNGENAESLNEIKSRAILFYTTQNRAITESDFNILISRYSGYSDFKAIALWGGQKEYINASYSLVENGPFQDTGYIYVSALKDNADIYKYSYLTETEKTNITDFFAPYKFTTMLFKYVNPITIYISPSIRIKLKNLIDIDANIIQETIDEYLTDTYTGMNKTFSKSNATRFIDSIGEINYSDFTYETYCKFVKATVSETYSVCPLNGAISTISSHVFTITSGATDIPVKSQIISGTYVATVIDNNDGETYISVKTDYPTHFTISNTYSVIKPDGSTFSATLSDKDYMYNTSTFIFIQNSLSSVTTIGYISAFPNNNGYIIFSTYSGTVLENMNSFAFNFDYTDNISIEAEKRMFLCVEPSTITYI